VSLDNGLRAYCGSPERLCPSQLAADGTLVSYLPCTVNQPNSANRCGTFNDAKWAPTGWVGQDQWSTMLMGGWPVQQQLPRSADRRLG
jgi:hypothetical protein